VGGRGGRRVGFPLNFKKIEIERKFIFIHLKRENTVNC
jgi:hypothetical protein